MSIIDILDVDVLSFTVDNTVNEVSPTDHHGDLWTNQETVVPDKSYFFDNDNLILVSIGIWFPYCFHFSNGLPFKMQILWFDGVDYNVIPELNGLDGTIGMPSEQPELDLNIFLKHPGDWRQSLVLNNSSFGSARISMIGVPDELNGEELTAKCWMKVKHTLQMTDRNRP